MRKQRKVCVVTGTRAEYGLLYWVMKEIEQSLDFKLQTIVTGMHLSPEFGLTYKEIEQDGFFINERVEMLLSSDSVAGTVKSLGLATIGFADAFGRLDPDLVILLGDRYEILAAAQAALVAKIPVAHIAGGDTTEGAFDEAIRHSITKMSHLHFVTNSIAAQRVRQLGENPEYIYNVGSPGLDHLKRVTLLNRQELEETLNFSFLPRNLLITFHPVTLDSQPATEQLQELLIALDDLGPGMGLIFTKPNADPEGRALIRMLEEYVEQRPNASIYPSLGHNRYLSIMKQVDAVVGNSSSGLYEVPSFSKPTVNIGDRQKGRLKATSVIDCIPSAGAISEAIRTAFEKDCSDTINPYGDGNSSQKIVTLLMKIPDFKHLLKKRFFEVKYDEAE